MDTSQQHTQDRLGHIEQAGVEHLPEAARDSRPRNLAAVFLGANLSLVIAVYGALPIAFGLSWWATVTSILAGLAIGTVLVAPLALIGPRTGTNATVSSSAQFGIRGRLIGSGITLGIALVFGAVAIWTGGDALVATADRLLGTPTGDAAHAVAYGLITAIVVLVAIYGHATLVAAQKLVVPAAGVVMLLGLVAYGGDFDAGHAGGEYLLSGFWPTWILCVVLAASTPLSYAANLGDYTRRIARSHPDRAVTGAVGFGLFAGSLVPSLFGAYTAVAFFDPEGDWIAGLVANAPGWYVAPLLVLALTGGLGQGALCLYSSGLDLEGVVPRLSRVHTTLLTSAAAIVLLYLGVFVLDAVASITASALILNALIAPWVAILAISALRHRTRGFDARDIQAFAEGRRGRYWFSGGWNVPACAAWAAGAAFGVLTVNSEPLYVGPLADLADGVDLSLAGSMLLAAAIYLAALVLTPHAVEPDARVPAPAPEAETTHVLMETV